MCILGQPVMLIRLILVTIILCNTAAYPFGIYENCTYNDALEGLCVTQLTQPAPMLSGACIDGYYLITLQYLNTMDSLTYYYAACVPCSQGSYITNALISAGSISITTTGDPYWPSFFTNGIVQYFNCLACPSHGTGNTASAATGCVCTAW